MQKPFFKHRYSSNHLQRSDCPTFTPVNHSDFLVFTKKEPFFFEVPLRLCRGIFAPKKRTLMPLLIQKGTS